MFHLEEMEWGVGFRMKGRQGSSRFHYHLSFVYLTCVEYPIPWFHGSSAWVGDTYGGSYRKCLVRRRIVDIQAFGFEGCFFGSTETFSHGEGEFHLTKWGCGPSSHIVPLDSVLNGEK